MRVGIFVDVDKSNNAKDIKLDLSNSEKQGEIKDGNVAMVLINDNSNDD